MYAKVVKNAYFRSYLCSEDLHFFLFGMDVMGKLLERFAQYRAKYAFPDEE